MTESTIITSILTPPLRLQSLETLHDNLRTNVPIFQTIESKRQLCTALIPGLSDSNNTVVLKTINVIRELVQQQQQQQQKNNKLNQQKETVISSIVLGDLISRLGDPKMVIRKATGECLGVISGSDPAGVMRTLVTHGFENEDWRIRKESADVFGILIDKITESESESEGDEARSFDLDRSIASLVTLLQDSSDIVVTASSEALEHVRIVFGHDVLLDAVGRLNPRQRILFANRFPVDSDASLSVTKRGDVVTGRSGVVEETKGTGTTKGTQLSSSPHVNSEVLEFGYIPSYVISQLKEDGDWKARASAVEALQTRTENLDNTQPVLPHLSELIAFLSALLLEDPNFKIALTTLHVLQDLVTKVGTGLKPCLASLVSTLVQKFADNKIVIRQANVKVLTHLMQIMTPKPILALCLRSLSHENARVREEIVNIVITALLTFRKYEFEYPSLMADLLTALRDPKAKVKYMAVEAYAVMGKSMGHDRLVRMLRDYGVDEDTLQMLRLRFENPLVPMLTADGMVEHILSRSLATPRSAMTPSGMTNNTGAGALQQQNGKRTEQPVYLRMPAKSAPAPATRYVANDIQPQSAGPSRPDPVELLHNMDGDGVNGSRRYWSAGRAAIMKTAKLPWEKEVSPRVTRRPAGEVAVRRSPALGGMLTSLPPEKMSNARGENDDDVRYAVRSYSTGHYQNGPRETQDYVMSYPRRGLPYAMSETVSNHWQAGPPNHENIPNRIIQNRQQQVPIRNPLYVEYDGYVPSFSNSSQETQIASRAPPDHFRSLSAPYGGDAPEYENERIASKIPRQAREEYRRSIERPLAGSGISGKQPGPQRRATGGEDPSHSHSTYPVMRHALSLPASPYITHQSRSMPVVHDDMLPVALWQGETAEIQQGGPPSPLKPRQRSSNTGPIAATTDDESKPAQLSKSTMERMQLRRQQTIKTDGGAASEIFETGLLQRENAIAKTVVRNKTSAGAKMLSYTGEEGGVKEERDFSTPDVVERTKVSQRERRKAPPKIVTENPRLETTLSSPSSEPSSPSKQSSGRGSANNLARSSPVKRSATVRPGSRSPENELKSAYLHLKDSAVDWTVKATALESIQALLAIPEANALFAPQLTELTLAVANEVTNLRSGVSKVAIAVIADMATFLGKTMDPHLDAFVTALLKKIGEGNNFLCEECDRVLEQLCTSVSFSRATSSLVGNSDGRNPATRQRVASLLATLVTRLSETTANRYMAHHDFEKLLPVLVRYSKEGIAETRNSAKRSLAFLSKLDDFERTAGKILPASQYKDLRQAIEGWEKRSNVLSAASTGRLSTRRGS